MDKNLKIQEDINEIQARIKEYNEDFGSTLLDKLNLTMLFCQTYGRQIENWYVSEDNDYVKNKIFRFAKKSANEKELLVLEYNGKKLHIKNKKKGVLENDLADIEIVFRENFGKQPLLLTFQNVDINDDKHIDMAILAIFEIKEGYVFDEKKMKIPLAELLLNSLGSSVNADMPTHRRICDLIRQAVLSHQLQGGSKLPSSRNLAADIGCSRNTVIAAYEQLLAEGYVVAQIGSGTVVADTLPTHQLETQQVTDLGTMPRGLSLRGKKLTASPSDSFYEIQEFIQGANDFSVFPYKIWQKLQNKYWREPQSAFMDYARLGGYQPLRAVLAEYLRVSRSVRCEPEQILITAGTQQSLDLCANLLADANDLVWMENPGYWGARRVFESNDLSLRPIDRKSVV